MKTYSFEELEHIPIKLVFPTHEVNVMIAWCPGFFCEANIGKLFEFRNQVFSYEGENVAKITSLKL